MTRQALCSSDPAQWPGRILLATSLLLAACTAGDPGTIDMMPAPVAYESVPVPFGQASDIGGDEAVLDILYATNRAPAADGDADHYSGERGYLVRLGAAQVSFGDNPLTWDTAREISLLKNRSDQFPLHATGVTEFGILPDSVSEFTPLDVAHSVNDEAFRRFTAEVNRRLARSSLKDVFVYVHGYKVPFDNPLLVAAEMWHFLGYEGAFVAFSWPSTPSRLAYFKDTETARVSSWGLRRLVQYLARETSAERIHIVGYSAGTRVVLSALHDLGLANQKRPEDRIRELLKLGNVVLVGSDVDTGIFAGYLIDGMLRVPEQLTLYASREDKALHISETVFSHRRMGEVLHGSLDARMREYVTRNPELTLVDVTGAADFDAGNGHAYFRKSPWVSSDVLMTLRYGMDPETRGLVRDGESPVWKFPADYPERFRSALAGIDPELRSLATADPELTTDRP